MTEVVTYREALAESMHNALERNDNSVIFGQGVDDFKGTFGTTLGLAEKFGAQRVQDVPIIEEGITGICMGAAMNGLRPIHVHIRADFLFLALNQVLNMASFWLMTGGMSFMTFVLTFAGTVQTHMQRVLGENFMDVQEGLGLFYIMRWGAGAAVVLGAILFIYAQLAPRREVIARSASEEA